MGARNCFKPQGYLLISILLVRFVADYVGGVQIPVTRSNRKGAVSASFFFFHQFPRTLAPLRHTMIVETGSPPPNSFHTEVPYEQLPVQRIRQQQLDLDRPHRPAVLLLLRRLLNALPAPPLRGSLFSFGSHFAKFTFHPQKSAQGRCVFKKNVL